jgi:hypothetical protein
MGNFCQQIRERAILVGVDLSISKQQEYNRFINDRIENGVHITDALDSVYDKIKNDFNIRTFESQVKNNIEKSNIDFFITKYNEKLRMLRVYHENINQHIEAVKQTINETDDRVILFRVKEMIYIDILNSLKIIKNNLK